MVDPGIVHAWLAGRSIGRGLPAPVADRGGFRVDTGSATEVRRWVFADVEPGLVELGRTTSVPRHFLKLCGDVDALRDVLPDRWEIREPGYLMMAEREPPICALAEGYRIAVSRAGPVCAVQVLSGTGELAASGYAAETAQAFVYDRIETAPPHRRKGLGRIVMTSLRAAKRNRTLPELLVATEEGRGLYSALNWTTISTFSTAALADCG